MSPKARFKIPELESENAKRHRIAREITKATNCRFHVVFKPDRTWDNEDMLPIGERESRGHVFEIGLAPYTGMGNALRFGCAFDDRESDPFEYVADHLRELAERLTEAAVAVDALGLKGGGA